MLAQEDSNANSNQRDHQKHNPHGTSRVLHGGSLLVDGVVPLVNAAGGVGGEVALTVASNPLCVPVTEDVVAASTVAICRLAAHRRAKTAVPNDPREAVCYDNCLCWTQRFAKRHDRNADIAPGEFVVGILLGAVAPCCDFAESDSIVRVIELGWPPVAVQRARIAVGKVRYLLEPRLVERGTSHHSIGGNAGEWTAPCRAAWLAALDIGL